MHMHAFRREWTTDDLLDMPDDGQRYEVIDGELFVSPPRRWTIKPRSGCCTAVSPIISGTNESVTSSFRRPTSLFRPGERCSLIYSSHRQ